MALLLCLRLAGALLLQRGLTVVMALLLLAGQVVSRLERSQHLCRLWCRSGRGGAVLALGLDLNMVALQRALLGLLLLRGSRGSALFD